jgi:DNA-directed RNA polymerase subunit H (RpoH/RPB5)
MKIAMDEGFLILNLESAQPTQKCRVLFVPGRLKNRLPGFLGDINESTEKTTTEVVVITLEPIGEVFHAAAYSALTNDQLRIAFFQAHTVVNHPAEHVLVPKHEKVPSSEHTELLKELRVRSKANLPIIRFHEDMQARVLGLVPGDIVKITRPSPSAGEYIVYRVCLP